jgi:hypothetical protein
MQNNPNPLPTDAANDDDVVDRLPDVAARGNFSPSTLNRLIEAGHGPPVVCLSKRRKGIRRGDWRAWVASRTRRPVPGDETTGEPALGRNNQQTSKA